MNKEELDLESIVEQFRLIVTDTNLTPIEIDSLSTVVSKLVVEIERLRLVAEITKLRGVE